VIKKFRKF